MIPVFVAVILCHDVLQLKHKELVFAGAMPEPGRVVSAHHGEGAKGCLTVWGADGVELATGADVGDGEHGGFLWKASSEPKAKPPEGAGG